MAVKRIPNTGKRIPLSYRVVGNAMILGMAAGCAAICASKNIPPAWRRMKGTMRAAKSDALASGKREWEKFKGGVEACASNARARAGIIADSRRYSTLNFFEKAKFIAGDERTILRIAQAYELNEKYYEASNLYFMAGDLSKGSECWSNYTNSPLGQLFEQTRVN